MDKKEEKPAEPAAQPAQAQQPGQDVSPPPAAEKKPEDKPAEAPKEAAAPAGDALAPAPDVSGGELPIPEQPTPPKPKQAKQPGSHVGLAIVATIIIVLGLAALATFAFLQSK